MDSLAWWRDTLGVDGFRFDLAPVLENTCEHGCFHFERLNSRTTLNRLVRELSPRPAEGGPGVDLIAEPWAIGDGTYQVGGFPLGWSEWNDKFRDSVRKSQNKLGIEDVRPGELALRLAGSADLFQNNGRLPFNSINFVVAHDGFTLHDLYSFTGKNNQQPFPFGPSDGGNDNNLSWDQGGVAADQRKAARTGLSLLLLSAGTPMLTGGDEFLRTLNGNNNPYNLDTTANWLNYTFDADQTNFSTFAKRLIAFRKQHPALRPRNFYSTQQVQWFKPDGTMADPPYFDDPSNHAIAWRIEGSPFSDPAFAIYVAYNGWRDNVRFKLPPPGASRSWFRVLDTSLAENAGAVALPGSETLIGAESADYDLHGRAVLLLIAK